MKNITKILAVIGGIVAVAAAVAAVLCFLKKKDGCKESKKYVSCPPEEDLEDAIDEIEDTAEEVADEIEDLIDDVTD